MSTTDAYYYTTTSSTSIEWDSVPKHFYMEDYNRFKKNPDRSNNSFKTKLIGNFENIMNELGIVERDISIAAFTKYGSDVEKDLNILTHKIPCYTHITHPVESDPQHEPVNLSSYDISVVSDVLENTLSKMARANIIKEALSSLKHTGRSCLIIKAKSEEEAKMSKEIVLNEDNLISLAIYAGATKTWKLKCMEKAEFPLIVANNGG